MEHVRMINDSVHILAMTVAFGLFVIMTWGHWLVARKLGKPLSRTWIATCAPFALLTFMILCDGVYLDKPIIWVVGGYAVIQGVAWTWFNSKVKGSVNASIKVAGQELSITKAGVEDAK